MAFSEIMRVLSLIEPNARKKYYWLVFFRAILVLLDLVALGLLGAFFTLITAEIQGGRPVYLGISLGFSFADYGTLILGLIGFVFVSKSGFTAIAMMLMARLIGAVETEAAGKISNYLFLGNLSRLREYSQGEVLWATGNSTTAAFSQRLTSFSNFIAELAMVGAISLFLFLSNPALAVIVAVYFVGLTLFFSKVVNKWVGRLSSEIAVSGVNSGSAMTQMLQLYREFRVTKQTPFFLRGYRESRGHMARATAMQAFASSLPRIGLEVALYLGAVLFLSVVLLSDVGITGLVGFTVLMVGASRIVVALVPLQRAVTDLRSDAGVAELALTILELGKESPASDADPLTLVTRRSEHYRAITLEFSNVSYRYPEAPSSAVEALSFYLSPGTFAALIGPSGGGKSTIVDLILGFVEPDVGEVRLEGLPPQQFLNSFPGRVGFVPQKPGVVQGTLRDNIVLGSIELDEARLAKVIGSVLLEDLVAGRPEGSMAGLGKQLDSLSGGQAQRLSLARALYLDPDLLVLDEATSALDVTTESQVMKNVFSQDRARTTVVVAHRLSTVAKADIVFLVDGGKIVDAGTFPELRSRNPKVQEFAELSEF